jgi:hypothetical protein
MAASAYRNKRQGSVGMGILLDAVDGNILFPRLSID